MKRALLALAPALVLAAAARPAFACDPPELVDYNSWPGDGEADVAVNEQILITIIGKAKEIADPQLTLVDSAMHPVATTITALPSPGPDRHIWLMVPDAPLQPSTKYYLEDVLKWNCTAEPCSTPLGVKRVFTTGTRTDTTPPLDPVPVVAQTSTDACDGAGCCGTYRAVLTDLQNPATGAVRYDLYDSGTLVETNAPFEIVTDCAQGGDVPYPSTNPSARLAPGHHHLTLAAYDEAGNETMSTQALDLDLSCDAVPPPAGLDAGTSAPPGGSGGGCNASSGSSLGLAGVLGLASIIAKRRRRANG